MGQKYLSPSAAERFAAGMTESKRPTGVVLGSLVSGAMVMAISVVGGLIMLVSVMTPSTPSGPSPVVMALGFIGVWLVALLWLGIKEKRSFASLGFRQRNKAPVQVLRGAGAAVAAVGVGIAVGVATGDLVFVGGPGGYFSVPAVGPVLFALLVFTIQGGAEEIMTRGYLLQVWYRRFGLGIAIAVQTVVFVAMHMGNDGFSLLAATELTLFAILTAFWALSDGALWGVVAFHATWNWVLGSVFGASVSGSERLPDTLFSVAQVEDANPWITGGTFGLEGSAITLVILLTLTAIAISTFVRGQRASRAQVAAFAA